MALLRRSSREERFWRWFEDNSTRLFAFESDQENVFDQLQGALGKVDKGLTFEFGPVEGGAAILSSAPTAFVRSSPWSSGW